MRKLIVGLIAFAIVFSIGAVVFRSVTVAKQGHEQDNTSRPFGSRAFDPRGGVPAVHDDELY